MKKYLFTVMLILATVLLMLTGCGKNQKKQKEDAAKTTTQEIKMTKVYIGTKDDFGKYNITYTGKLTPEKLLRGITDTTGWNLDLAEKVTVDKENGYKVAFDESSVFYTGQKADKQDEFYVEGTENFYATVLDSVKETFDKHYGKKGEEFKIYYFGPDESALKIAEIGKTLVMGSCYKSFYVYTPGQSSVYHSNNVDTYDTEGVFIGQVDGENFKMRVGAQINTYRVTYAALKTIIKTSSEGDILKVRIKEDNNTGEKLLTKIFWRQKK